MRHGANLHIMLLNTGEFREKECRDGPNAHTVKSYDILKVKNTLMEWYTLSQSTCSVEERFAFCLCEDVQWH
jgi:hypothetical protein